MCLGEEWTLALELKVASASTFSFQVVLLSCPWERSRLRLLITDSARQAPGLRRVTEIPGVGCDSIAQAVQEWRDERCPLVVLGSSVRQHVASSEKQLEWTPLRKASGGPRPAYPLTSRKRQPCAVGMELAQQSWLGRPQSPGGPV